MGTVMVIEKEKSKGDLVARGVLIVSVLSWVFTLYLVVNYTASMELEWLAEWERDIARGFIAFLAMTFYTMIYTILLRCFRDTIYN